MLSSDVQRRYTPVRVGLLGPELNCIFELLYEKPGHIYAVHRCAATLHCKFLTQRIATQYRTLPCRAGVSGALKRSTVIAATRRRVRLDTQ